MSASTGTPDGYDICPSCGHHTSAAVGGICTVLVPFYIGETDQVWAVDYCNCDCYKALYGISLTDKIFGGSDGEARTAG